MKLESYFGSDKLKFYNPYNFDRNITNNNLLEYLLEDYEKYIQKNEFHTFEVKGEKYIFIYKALQWDTEYFKIPTFRLINILSVKNNYLKEAILFFKESVLPEDSYCFMEIPSEDIELIQALGESCFKLVETRLTYYNNTLQLHQYPRYLVRSADKNDIPNLKMVASEMRNDYDRFHADKVFETTQADLFLSTYIENSILGLTDYVMVPNEKNVKPDSFLTANYLRNEWPKINCKISKMVLSAVSSETNKGWYIKLISEMTYHLRDTVGSECIFLNTQSTNRAVFSTWEKLGYKLGCTTHVFSITKKIK
ncbi:MAG: hypothetical protein H7141_01915 [Burkholderiales bacterium]|nr:hypothetical protein [Bacteroidia bacterium]